MPGWKVSALVELTFQWGGGYTETGRRKVSNVLYGDELSVAGRQVEGRR